MQGLAGCYGECDRQLVQRMLERIKHRGPDASKIVEDDNHIVGSTAMARRPGGEVHCIAEENGIVVTADSYFYNKRELVQEYFGTGAEPDISDVELLVEMYRSAGTSLFGMIDGAYAIALTDGAKLILARDKYGMKPLYLSGNGKNGFYSSEMKAQVSAGSDFRPFPPGSMFIQSAGIRNIERQRAPKAKDKTKPEEALRKLLLESADQCIEDSDSVNILLSGGIDSSAVAAAASLTTADIDTVCVGLAESADVVMARLVASYLGTGHTERIYGIDDMLQVIDEAIYALESFDYPLVRSCIPNYIATHLFHRRGKIALVGEGGDEILAGHAYMQGIKNDSALRKERASLLASGHSTSFQRVDRTNASASLDGRMPLMHSEIVDLGMGMGRKDLIGANPNESKLVLRKAFEGLLPREVVWRTKQKFDGCMGPTHPLEQYAEETISDQEFEKERKLLPRGRIRTKEELMYFRSFNKFFHNKSCYNAVGLTETL